MTANPTNTCKHLVVGNETHETPFKEMMQLQIDLQKRLDRLPSKDLSPKETAYNVIYWRHCAQAECDELLEWFDNTEELVDSLEVEMEAIDVLHFVFNIGIALNIYPEDVQDAMDRFVDAPVKKEGFSLGFLRYNILRFSSCLTFLIDQLPWKSWKSYNNYVANQDLIKSYYTALLFHNIHIANCLGMSTRRVYNVYLAKNKENHARQDRGY